MKITFELLHEDHCPVLLKWLSTPHVKTWWDSDTNWTLSSIENKFGFARTMDSIGPHGEMIDPSNAIGGYLASRPSVT